MRVWDLPPAKLCRLHLLGEHREVHAIWSILTKGKKGYSHHPETKRWKGKLHALYLRHAAIAREMKKRGYRHLTPLPEKFAASGKKQTIYIDTPLQQAAILKGKKCQCKV